MSPPPRSKESRYNRSARLAYSCEYCYESIRWCCLVTSLAAGIPVSHVLLVVYYTRYQSYSYVFPVLQPVELCIDRVAVLLLI